MGHTGTTPSVFISYSHDDKEWKDSVVRQLKVLEYEGLFSVWDDRRIDAGNDWLPEIETAIQSCNMALLLISAQFLTSKFIRGKEVPALLQRREQEGVQIIPVILEPCPWKKVQWLKSMEVRPKDGTPLSSMSDHDAKAVLVTLVEEIVDLLDHSTPTTKPDSLYVAPPDKIEAQDVLETITEQEANIPADVGPINPTNPLNVSCEVTSAGGAQETEESTEISTERQDIRGKTEVPLKPPEESALKTLLCSYNWLKVKLQAAEISNLVNNLSRLPENAEATQIGAALLLSARVLTHNPEQLAGQLHGRLETTDGPQIAQLLADARSHAEPWSLLPIRPTLTRPDPGLICYYAGHSYGDILAVLPDGCQVLSSLPNGTLGLWDIKSGQKIREFAGDKDRVTAVAVSPEGRWALWGSKDGTLRLLDLESKQQLRQQVLSKLNLWFSDYKFTAVAISSTPHMALSGHKDGAIRLWNLDSKDKPQKLAEYENPVTAMTISADGRWALSAHTDRTLRMWDLVTRKKSQKSLQHEQLTTAVVFLPDSQRALTGDSNGTLWLWDLNRGIKTRGFTGYRGGVTTIAILQKGRQALSGHEDGMLQLWDLENREEILKFPRHSGWVTGLAVLPDGRRALSGSSDQTLRLWDLDSGEEIRKFEGHSGGVTAVAVLPDGQRALSGSSDQTLRLWDPKSEQEIKKLEGHSGGVTAVAALPDGRRALSGSQDHTLRLWDLDSGEEIRKFEWPDVCETYTETIPPNRPAPHPYIAVDMIAWVKDCQTVTRTRVVKHGRVVTAVAVLPSGRQVLLGSSGGELWLWDLDLESRNEIQTFAVRGGVTALVVLPDGAKALSGSSDGSLRLWDLASGKEIGEFPGHSSGVTALAALPDGHRIFSVSLDKTLRLWDLDSGDCLARFDMDTAVTCCAVVPDKRWIIVGDDQGSIHVLASIRQESSQ